MCVGETAPREPFDNRRLPCPLISSPSATLNALIKSKAARRGQGILRPRLAQRRVRHPHLYGRGDGRSATLGSALKAWLGLSALSATRGVTAAGTRSQTTKRPQQVSAGASFWVRRGIKPQREYSLSDLYEDSVAQRGREVGFLRPVSSQCALPTSDGGSAPAAWRYSHDPRRLTRNRATFETNIRPTIVARRTDSRNQHRNMRLATLVQ